MRTLTFYPEHGCYLVRWRGEVSAASTEAHWRDLVSRQEWNPELSALHDIRGRTISRSYVESRAESEAFRELVPQGGGRVAILVDSALTFGLSRQLMSLMALEGTSLVTYSEREAKRWVGLPADCALPPDDESAVD